MILLGIDPGLSGALAFMGTDGALDVDDAPTFTVERGGKMKRDLDLALIVERISAARPGHCFIERVGAMPGQGVTSMFTFGRAVGQIEGVLAALGIPRTYVTPQTWKRDLKVPAGKDAARLRASELMPAHAERWRLVKHDGRAEAALIALWGLTHFQGLARGAA